MKTKLINGVLWLALILAMAASVNHLAWTFGTVEQPGAEWLGWIPALAVDTGLAALAYTIQQRKRAKRPVAILWYGVAGFAVVSALANFYHALAVEGFALSGSFVAVAKAVILSATLPAAYIFLGEIVSGDDAKAADDLVAQAERERRKADREAERERAKEERDLLETKRLLLEAEQAASEAVPEVAQAEILCSDCGRGFATINALNAHRRIHQRLEIAGSNGKAHN